MAVVSCPECGIPISDTAASCRGCGAQFRADEPTSPAFETKETSDDEGKKRRFFRRSKKKDEPKKDKLRKGDVKKYKSGEYESKKDKPTGKWIWVTIKFLFIFIPLVISILIVAFFVINFLISAEL